jgi:hypothetical protein
VRLPASRGCSLSPSDESKVTSDASREPNIPLLPPRLGSEVHPRKHRPVTPDGQRCDESAIMRRGGRTDPWMMNNPVQGTVYRALDCGDIRERGGYPTARCAFPWLDGRGLRSAIQICGHWALPSNDWQPPSDLLDFLAAGAPPIYVGFGAVSSFIRQRGLTEIATAIAGRRALFYPGWSKITSALLPGNFFVVGDTPHTWLFPRASMVIHHSGAGTTHSAARAGVPSIALPVGADQFFWAGRLAAAGVAPKYIRATKIDARSLARMIDFAEGDGVRRRARALGAAMAEESGVAAAVKAIEILTAKMSG